MKILRFAVIALFAASSVMAQVSTIGIGKMAKMPKCVLDTRGSQYTITNASEAGCDNTQAVGLLTVSCRCQSADEGVTWAWAVDSGGEVDLSAYEGAVSATKVYDAEHPADPPPSHQFIVAPAGGDPIPGYDATDLTVFGDGIQARARTTLNTFTLATSSASGLYCEGGGDAGIYSFTVGPNGVNYSGSDLSTLSFGVSGNNRESTMLGYDGIGTSTGFRFKTSSAGTGGRFRLMVDDVAALDIDHSDSAVFIGCRNNGKRENSSTIPGSPAECDTFFDTTLHIPCFYNGSEWKSAIDGTTNCSNGA